MPDTKTEIIEDPKPKPVELANRGQPLPTPPPPQDLGITKPVYPQKSWIRPLHMVASQARLDEPHQRVDIKNTSDTELAADGRVKPQIHIFLDRQMKPIEVRPGDTVNDVDMLVHDIEYFLRERDERTDLFGSPKPRHPIEIIGFDPKKVIRNDVVATRR